MKAFATFRSILALVALLTLGGCCTTWCGGHYEYRYRVFQAREPMARQTEGPLDAAILSQRYLPADEINRSMDLLCAEGFALWKIERVRDTEYYTFIFRRTLQRGERAACAPREFTGVYRDVTPGAKDAAFYALQPTYAGCSVVRFQDGAKPETVEAAWDGEKLVGDGEGDVRHTFVLAGDGFSLSHVREVASGQSANRQVFTAERVGNGR